MERKFRGCGAESSDEVVLECADGTFGIVASVDSWRDKLECSVGVMEVVFEGLTALIVHDVELWFATVADKAIIEELVGFEYGGSFSIGNGCDIDGIAVVMVEQEDVVVASA